MEKTLTLQYIQLSNKGLTLASVSFRLTTEAEAIEMNLSLPPAL